MCIIQLHILSFSSSKFQLVSFCRTYVFNRLVGHGYCIACPYGITLADIIYHFSHISYVSRSPYSCLKKKQKNKNEIRRSYICKAQILQLLALLWPLCLCLFVSPASGSESDVSPEKRARVSEVPQCEESSSSSSSSFSELSSSSSSSRGGSKQRSRKRCHRCQTKLELVQQELGSCRCGTVIWLFHIHKKLVWTHIFTKMYWPTHFNASVVVVLGGILVHTEYRYLFSIW